MAGRSEAQRIRIGEEVLVVLPEREYEALLANRRQVGGCTARVRALKHALTEALSRLAAAEATATGGGAPDSTRQASRFSASGNADGPAAPRVRGERPARRDG